MSVRALLVASIAVFAPVAAFSAGHMEATAFVGQNTYDDDGTAGVVRRLGVTGTIEFAPGFTVEGSFVRSDEDFDGENYGVYNTLGIRPAYSNGGFTVAGFAQHVRVDFEDVVFLDDPSLFGLEVGFETGPFAIDAYAAQVDISDDVFESWTTAGAAAQFEVLDGLTLFGSVQQDVTDLGTLTATTFGGSYSMADAISSALGSGNIPLTLKAGWTRYGGDLVTTAEDGNLNQFGVTLSLPLYGDGEPDIFDNQRTLFTNYAF